MRNILKKLLVAGAFIAFIASPVMTLATPQDTVAKGPCGGSVLGIPPWYRGLTTEVNGNCEIASPEQAGGLEAFIWRIVLNVVEMGLVITSWIALFFILYGGFLFVTGGGNPSQVEKGRKSIFAAVIGLVISIGAIAITNLIFNMLLGSGIPNDYGVKEIDANALLINGLNLAYYIAGIIAVIVIIIAGIMYATSMGDAGRIGRAKNMILYAVIGIGVILAAWSITNFVLLRF